MPPLPGNSVHVWIADLHADGPELQRLSNFLDCEEHRRAERLLCPTHKMRFVVAHALLRQALASYVSVRPFDLEFKRGPGGKPAIEGGGEIEFNLSHSRDLAALAVARNLRVGIDIEDTRRRVDFLLIARRFFQPFETARIAASSNPNRAFYLHWTGKEAYLKALGRGLSGRLDSVEVLPGDGGEPPRLRIEDSAERGRWSLRQIQTREDMVCSVVAESADWDIEVAEWSELRFFPEKPAY